MPRVACVLLVAVAFLSAACNLPFGIDTPTTRALERGVVAMLDDSLGFEISGAYAQIQVAPPPPVVSGARVSAPTVGARWTMDLQLTKAIGEHAVLGTGGVTVEAIVIQARDAYFRGQEFLSEHLGSDPHAQELVRAAGNAWWKGPLGLLPQLPDLTEGVLFRAAFLGPAVTSRTDHVQIDGVDAVELSGRRADVYVASSAPYELVHFVMHSGVKIDGIADAELRYTNYGKDFAIAAPTDVIDFSNLSTLPPIYTVLSVDTSRCGTPCVVSALLKNLGGATGAKGPSTVTFTLADSATGAAAGSCQVQVVPDVGYNATTTVSCTIALSGAVQSAAIVTATVDNPGRG